MEFLSGLPVERNNRETDFVLYKIYKSKKKNLVKTEKIIKCLHQFTNCDMLYLDNENVTDIGNRK